MIFQCKYNHVFGHHSIEVVQSKYQVVASIRTARLRGLLSLCLFYCYQLDFMQRFYLPLSHSLLSKLIQFIVKICPYITMIERTN